MTMPREWISRCVRVAACIALMSCGPEVGGEGRGAQLATKPCLWALQGHTELRELAHAALEDASEARPDDPRIAFYRGMCALAAYTEDGDAAKLPIVEPSLARAHQLSPDMRNVRANLWLVRLNAASARGDMAALQAATRELIATAEREPFDTFVMSLGLTRAPVASGLPAQAAERFAGFVERCKTFSFCRNSPLVRHHDPAMYVHAGDLFARIGDAARARTYYAQALTAEGARSWPFAREARDWAADVDTRVALHADSDPRNDPPPFLSGARTCVGCHQ